MGKLLFDESPLVVQPTLAKAIGLNEAIVLQQLHYWLTRDKIGKEIDGVRWIWNSLSDWQKNFPWWSESTVSRALQSLEEQGLIKTGCFNQRKGDRTKWFTIAYDKVAEVERGGVETPSSHNETSTSQDETTLPETSPKISSPEEEESPAPKVNAYASYNAAFGEPIPNPSSPRVLNAVEDLEEFPGAWIDTAFLRTSKKERSTNERWQYYRRLPYALSLLNEWKHAGAILPEKTPPKPAPPRAAPRAPASNAPPDADAARQRAIAEWKRARLANSTGIGASGKSP